MLACFLIPFCVPPAVEPLKPAPIVARAAKPAGQRRLIVYKFNRVPTPKHRG